MLFAYKYIPHQMEKMQEFIDFIFFEVWCRAPGKGGFSLDLFDANVELKELMKSLYYGDTDAGDFFYGHVERIYWLFAGLTPPQIDQFRQWYQANNDIKGVCENDPVIHIARYNEVVSVYPVVGKQLASFFRNLYDKSFLNLAAVKEKIGDIRDHNRQFFTTNNVGICPFCGINHLKGIHHTRREAYDHYLPKYRYPFNSVNFRNLAPACHECNSVYKLSRDPAHNKTGRRKSFYPYAVDDWSVEISIDLKSADIDKLAPSDIELAFGPVGLHEEIETWKEVYGIEERYKAKCCEANDGKYWLMQILDEWRIFGVLPKETLAKLSHHTKNSPYADSNFLRKPFLDACEKIGLFEIITPQSL